MAREQAPFNSGYQKDANERIGRLETSVDGLRSELGEIRIALRGIMETLSRSKETNWSVIFAGLAVAGSFYAAAIRPLASDIERIRGESNAIRQRADMQGDFISNLRSETVRSHSEFQTLQRVVDQIYKDGSPLTDKRLSLLEAGLRYTPKEAK